MTREAAVPNRGRTKRPQLPLCIASGRELSPEKYVRSAGVEKRLGGGSGIANPKLRRRVALRCRYGPLDASTPTPHFVLTRYPQASRATSLSRRHLRTASRRRHLRPSAAPLHRPRTVVVATRWMWRTTQPRRSLTSLGGASMRNRTPWTDGVRCTMRRDDLSASRPCSFSGLERRRMPPRGGGLSAGRTTDRFAAFGRRLPPHFIQRGEPRLVAVSVEEHI